MRWWHVDRCLTTGWTGARKTGLALRPILRRAPGQPGRWALRGIPATKLLRLVFADIGKLKFALEGKVS